MRLSGWKRVGIVLSMLWVLGAAIYERNGQVESAKLLYATEMQTCFESQAIAIGNCLDSYSLQEALDTTASWSNVAFIAFGPVIAAWTLFLPAVATFRWIRSGFRDSNVQ